MGRDQGRVIEIVIAQNQCRQLVIRKGIEKATHHATLLDDRLPLHFGKGLDTRKVRIVVYSLIGETVVILSGTKKILEPKSILDRYNYDSILLQC